MNPDLTSIVQALDRLEAALHTSTTDHFNLLLVVVTLGVLIWYTIETYKLRVAAQRQGETSVMPILAVFNEGSSFLVRNVGWGTSIQSTHRPL